MIHREDLCQVQADFDINRLGCSLYNPPHDVIICDCDELVEGTYLIKGPTCSMVPARSESTQSATEVPSISVP